LANKKKIVSRWKIISLAKFNAGHHSRDIGVWTGTEIKYLATVDSKAI